MSTNQKNISDFSREELLTILAHLYQLGSRQVALNQQIERVKQQQFKQGIKQALSTKRNRFSAISAGIIAFLMFFVLIDSGFFTGLIQTIIFFGIFFAGFRFAMEKKSKRTGKPYLNIQLSQTEKDRVLAHILESQAHLWANEEAEAQAIGNEDSFAYYLHLLPDNFSNVEDVAGMWSLLNDHRADNFKEAANTWRLEQVNIKPHLDQISSQILASPVDITSVNPNL